MKILKCLVIFSFVTATAYAEASVRAFRVYSVKQVTSQVDRFYGQDGGAFGTLFCREDAAEVMFVDSRVPELDGVSFYFASPQACYEARAKVRNSYRKCVTELQLNTQTMTAQVQTSKCP